MTSSSAHSFPEEAVPFKLATFLRERRKHLTVLWMDAVRQSPKVGAADRLVLQL